MPSLRGQLLVASPTLEDPNFSRSVILVCAHDDEGALGLILNRPSDLDAAAATGEIAATLGLDGVLFRGGPVSPDALVVLGEFAPDGVEFVRVRGQLGLMTTSASPEAAGASATRVRAFVGYAGWGPGQLDAELERDDWVVVDFVDDDAFSPEPEGLWVAALERRGGRYALLARMPPDPSMN